MTDVICQRYVSISTSALHEVKRIKVAPRIVLFVLDGEDISVKGVLCNFGSFGNQTKGAFLFDKEAVCLLFQNDGGQNAKILSKKIK